MNAKKATMNTAEYDMIFFLQRAMLDAKVDMCWLNLRIFRTFTVKMKTKIDIKTFSKSDQRTT